MAAASQYTEEQKAAFVALARDKGRKAASEKAGVSYATISYWAKAAGVTFTTGKKRKPTKKKAAAKSNGKSNGHAKTPEAQAETEPLPSFDSVQAQLLALAKSVAAMKAAFRKTFG